MIEPYQQGRIVCKCGWEHVIQGDDTKESVETIAVDHYRQHDGDEKYPYACFNCFQNIHGDEVIWEGNVTMCAKCSRGET